MKKNSPQHSDVQLQVEVSILDAVLSHGSVTTRDLLNGICATDMENWRIARQTNDKFATLSGQMGDLRADSTLLSYEDENDRRVFVYEAIDIRVVIEKLRSHLFYIIHLEDIDLWCENGQLKVATDSDHIFIDNDKLARLFVQYNILEDAGYDFDLE